MSKDYELDVPSGWTVERYEKTGHGKLIARFRCDEKDWELNIIPYKSYKISGFTNCHRITITKDDNVEVFAEGLEVEHANEAEKIAIEVMKSN